MKVDCGTAKHCFIQYKMYSSLLSLVYMYGTDLMYLMWSRIAQAKTAEECLNIHVNEGRRLLLCHLT